MKLRGVKSESPGIKRKETSLTQTPKHVIHKSFLINGTHSYQSPVVFTRN